VRNFGRVPWRGEPERAGAAVAFHYRSRDGEEGYPGNLDATVRYALREDALRIEFEARSDAPTVVNLTHHGYFDLSLGGGVRGHWLRLAAERYAVVDAERIPTGELRPAAGTPMDFASPRRLGEALAEVPEGFDHSYALSRSGELAFAARLSEPGSGRVMEVYTTQPALQLYTANHLDGCLVGKRGVPYGRHAGVCLEAQNFPDAPNQPAFPSPVLAPGQRYFQVIEYRFGVE
jgi:aldose 1-epimerase